MLMLIQKGQNLKIFAVAFSVFVFLGIMAPTALAGGGDAATVAAPIVFTNEVVIGGKRMIVETRIYEAPVVATVTTAANLPSVPAEGKQFIKPTRGNLVQGYHSGHYAYDIGDRTQPPVWAAGKGSVTKVVNNCDRVSYGCGGGYGNHVIIDHGNGLTTLYSHLESVSVSVADYVSQGTVIGKMGRSGNVRGASGMHLHFEVRLNGKKESPGDYY